VKLMQTISSSFVEEDNLHFDAAAGSSSFSCFTVITPEEELWLVNVETLIKNY
jgi:hypothetical protein